MRLKGSKGRAQCTSSVTRTPSFSGMNKCRWRQKAKGLWGAASMNSCGYWT